MARILLITILLHISAIVCDVTKSSLTFVIDDTGSMHKDIAQVKESANEIFDAVLGNAKSPIENFVLVTFNDPDVRPATITRDRDTFKRALNNIVVDGGVDCPEYAMSGIESALKESLPRSFVYVFTDASAKDYGKYEKVKSLAQKKSSQVVFILTNRCSEGTMQPDEQVYYDLADATSGQVFQLQKSSVNDILDFVTDSIKGLTTVIAKEKLPRGYGHKINYTADYHIKDVVISVTGDEPKIGDVTDPEGTKRDTETMFDSEKVAIVKVPEAKPGVYTAEVGSKSETTVVVTGKTTIDFEHGFSSFKPVSIKDTATRPQPDVHSYLSIKLNIVEGGEVTLTHVKLIDTDGKPILEEPLGVLDDKNRLYITDPIKTPNAMFRIVVTGYAVSDNSTVTRMSPTPIEPQNPDLEIKVPKAPKITIVGDLKVSVGYNEALKLTCKVNAFPKPDVIWVEQSSGSLFPSAVADVEPPYEYISILEIDKVNKNATYICKASNAQGMDEKNIVVEIPVYFIVMDSPKDAVVKYDTAGIFLCKIDASPPPTIKWYKNGNVVVNDDKNVISPDGSVLTIPKMEPRLQGHYSCDASNGVKNETFKFKVAISGVVAPNIDKHINKIHVTKGSDPELQCRLSEGMPPPRFIWYFKHDSDKRFRKLWGKNNNKISFKDIAMVHAGVYKCMAFNDIGHDTHEIELIVEYPPMIKEGFKLMSGNAGDELTLTCDVDGIPSPLVTWTKDDMLIKNTPTTPIYRDHSLRLKLEVEDTGIYKCQASNRLGKAMKEISVEVYVPAYIKPPKETPVNVKVGDDINLVCDADGIPEPELKWIFQDKDGKIIKAYAMASDAANLSIPRAQLDNTGYYTCMALNKGGSFNITYDVRVNAPPNIANIYKDKTFRPVEGDLVLIIKCNATGSPKPVITWTKDGMKIASGTQWYDIDEFGTLFIKNVDKFAGGRYVCRADNIFGQDTELFYVEVNSYPTDGSKTSNMLIEEGSTNRLECNMPHALVDSIRWYKDRELLSNGELTIYNAKLSDSGLYACRVSNHMKSFTAYTNVKVGFKPKFVTEEDENVELINGYPAELFCNADAEPPAKMTWWHNGIMLNVTSPEHYFQMSMSDNGNYTCQASNEFGKIQRIFFMQLRDCILNAKEDFTGNQPIMYTAPISWPSYDMVEGNMIIPRDDYVYLICPVSFTTSHSKHLTAFCSGEKKFKVKGITYNYSELKCNSAIEPNIFESGDECLGEGTEMLNIEYEVEDSFLRAYDVCYDINNKLPIYVTHKLDKHLADVEPESENWLNSELWPLNADKLYNCNTQIGKISIDLGKWFHVSDRCCFRKRQLISPRDMMPGLLQSSTYTYLNVAPQWSTCNKNNWDDLEQKLRNLAKSIDYPLTVWTGTHGHLSLPGRSSEMKTVNIGEKRGISQSVPHYLWKVIQDPVTHSSLAVVQINVPDLDSSKVFKHVLCGNICDDIPWLRGGQWHNVSQGYIFCCNITDFENAFRLFDIFIKGYDRVLQRVSLLSTHSLL